MSAIKYSILTFMLLSSISCVQAFSFPDKEDVDNFLTDVSAIDEYNQRLIQYQKFINIMSRPKDADDDKIVEYFINRIYESFENKKDVAILEAIENTDIDGGFATFICTFYGKIKKDEVFLKRYKGGEKEIRSIERCVGISFTKEEYSLISGEKATKSGVGGSMINN